MQGGIVAVGVMSNSQRQCDSGADRVVTATYVMSPLLVVAYAIAGTVAIDFTSEPIGVYQSFSQVLFHAHTKQ